MAPSKHSAPQIDGLYYGEKVLRSCCWLAGEKEELNDFLNDQTGRHTHTHTHKVQPLLLSISIFDSSYSHGRGKGSLQ